MRAREAVRCAKAERLRTIAAVGRVLPQLCLRDGRGLGYVDATAVCVWREDEDDALLARTISRCIAVCDQTIEAYAVGDPAPIGAHFAVTLRLSTAALESAAQADCGDPRRELLLLIAATLARDTAAAAHGHGPDELLLRCADACTRTAGACEAAAARVRT